MTLQPGQEEYGAVCPYLGLADDADSHATYATEAHRCYRLPNPTRIATGHQETYCLGANHVSCPVYLGEGVPGAAAPAAAAAATAAPAPRMPRPGATQTATRPPAPGEAQPVRGPRPGGAQTPRSGARRPNAGAIGPRPRSGGVSMPVATIGLFALALVVIGLAFAVNQLVDNGSGNSISPADQVRTTTAQKTQAAQGGQSTQPAGQTRLRTRRPAPTRLRAQARPRTLPRRPRRRLAARRRTWCNRATRAVRLPTRTA